MGFFKWNGEKWNGEKWNGDRAKGLAHVERSSAKMERKNIKLRST